MNTTKEQQIIRSLLLSDFHWVKIDSNGGSYSEKLKRNTFTGSVCAKAKFWDFSFGDEDKPLKTYKKEEDCQEWMPHNILHKSFESHMVDKTGKVRAYERFNKDIDGDTKLLLEIKAGSISGVGYGYGWEVHVGIIYKNIVFKLYTFKTSDNQYQLEAFYDIDYISSLDFSNMKTVKDNDDAYISEYYSIRTCNRTSKQDMADVLSLAMTDDTIVFSKEFSFNFKLIKGISSSDDCIFSKESLKLLKPKKILLQDNFNIEDSFDIPESLEEIVLDFKGHKYREEGITEQFIDLNKNLGKYLKCSSDCEKIAAREIYNKEVLLSNDPVHIWFTYKELSGFVSTDKYQLGLFEEFYKNAKEVLIKVGDAEFKMPIKNFWSCLTIEKDKKLKNRSAREKAMSVFGHKIGYIAWFPKEVVKRPEYTGKTKISTQEFTEGLEEKEIKRSKKESFKKTAHVEDILPALKEKETINKVVLKSIKDVAHDLFYEEDGLDDEGADETLVFKIGDCFYEIDLHCDAEWVGDWSVRKNLPGKVSVEAVREIKEFQIESETEGCIELKY